MERRKTPSDKWTCADGTRGEHRSGMRIRSGSARDTLDEREKRKTRWCRGRWRTARKFASADADRTLLYQTKTRSALKDVVTREYTIHLHKRVHGASFKKSKQASQRSRPCARIKRNRIYQGLPRPSSPSSSLLKSRWASRTCASALP